MANEITVNVSLQLTKGSLQYSQIPGSISVTMTGVIAAGGTQTTATGNGVALVLPAAFTTTNLGYAYFRNTSTVGNIRIGTGTSSFVPFMELLPGETSVLRLCSSTATTVTCNATTGTPVLQYWIAAL